MPCPKPHPRAQHFGLPASALGPKQLRATKLLLNQGPSEPCYVTEHSTSHDGRIRLPVSSADAGVASFSFRLLVDCSALHKHSSTCTKKGKGSPHLITERRVPELISVLGSQPAGDVSHKPNGRLPLLAARSAVTTATLKRAATNFAAW